MLENLNKKQTTCLVLRAIYEEKLIERGLRIPMRDSEIVVPISYDAITALRIPMRDSENLREPPNAPATMLRIPMRDSERRNRSCAESGSPVKNPHEG